MRTTSIPAACGWSLPTIVRCCSNRSVTVTDAVGFRISMDVAEMHEPAGVKEASMAMVHREGLEPPTI